jgi:hypothetical protein
MSERYSRQKPVDDRDVCGSELLVYLEHYRFVWHRSFHGDVTVRAARIAAQDCTSRYSGKFYISGPSCFGEAQWHTFDPTETQWQEFLQLLEDARFWSMASEVPEPLCLDGSNWVLSGRRGARTHHVQRHNPVYGSDEAGTDELRASEETLRPFVACCWHLLRMAAIVVPREEVY